MDNSYQLLISLLSAAIRNEHNVEINIENIDLKNIYEEATSHEVHSLIYPLVKTLCIDTNQLSNKEVLIEWRNMYILNSVQQLQHIDQIKKVLGEFNKLGIKVIALKGLVVRELYPYPELRSMSDADILVSKDDIILCKKLLKELGYIEVFSDNVHSQFAHENHLPIEVHWTLINEVYLKKAQDFQDKIWENTIPFKISNELVLALSPEYQIMHLCFHMLTHFLSHGFGLRQLCDLVLTIEYEKDSIDWNSFYTNCKINGIYNFVIAIFTVCNKLFGVKCPNYNLSNSPQDQHFINMLINDIISAGVHGKKNLTRINSTDMLRLQTYEHSRNSKNKFLLGLAFLFPPPSKLDIRYSYAQRIIFLTPVAWIHRFIYGVFKKDSHILKKANSFTSSLSITQERFELIKWLNI